MIEHGDELTERLAARLTTYREAFDYAFAKPADAPRENLVDVLLFRLGSAAFAARLSQLNGLRTFNRVVPMPGSSPLLLGIIGVRGEIIPVFSLASLLGCSADGSGHWLALCNGTEPVGLAFDEFLGLHRVRSADLYSEKASGGEQHAREMARCGSRVVPVIDIDSIIHQIRRSTNSGRRKS